MTAPDPQVVRDFARRAILSSAEDVDYIGIGEQFSDDENWPTENDASDAMLEAVDAERQKAIVTVSWPDEQLAAGRPAADFAHAAEDVRTHLALRARAVNDEVLRSPEVISVARIDGHSHALMETVLRTLLAERDALAAYVDARTAEQPQAEEAQHARTFLAGLRENITSYHQPLPGQPEHCTCGGASGCDRGGADLAAIATLDAVLNAAVPQYLVDGQPVDRESYEAWADEGRERDCDEAGIYYDEHDADEDGGPF